MRVITVEGALAEITLQTPAEMQASQALLFRCMLGPYGSLRKIHAREATQALVARYKSWAPERLQYLFTDRAAFAVGHATRHLLAETIQQEEPWPTLGIQGGDLHTVHDWFEMILGADSNERLNALVSIRRFKFLSGALQTPEIFNGALGSLANAGVEEYTPKQFQRHVRSEEYAVTIGGPLAFENLLPPGTLDT